MDFYKPRGTNRSLKLSNGYVLPQGKLTPNALFVGGIDLKVDEREFHEFFQKFGSVKEVKIITYRGGICKGYGFVYFHEDVNIQSIIEQQIIFNGRKLKLGPAIMKDRISRSVPSHAVGPNPWIGPPQYIYCTCCSSMGGGVTQPPTILNGGSTYTQPYVYNNNIGGVMMPQTPIPYAQNPYSYQVDLNPLPPHAVPLNFLECRPESSAYQSELSGLWSPNYADCAVVYGY